MSWERLRGLWWLWSILGLSGGVAFALWLSAPTTLSAPLDKDIDDLKAENSQLKGSLSAAQSQLQLALNDGRKWGFSYELRNTPKAENGPRISCQYAVGVSHTNAAFNSWAGLQQMIDLAWWRDAPTGGPTNNEFPYPPGITIRAGPQPTNSFKCASALQTALADIFSLNAALHVDQVTPSLSACKNECVEIDVGN